jgi:hypothetical protein
MSGEPVVAEDRSISLASANVRTLALVPVIALVALGPALLRWNGQVLEQGWNTFMQPLVVIPTLLLSIVVHEGLHGLGYLLGGAPRASIHFGIHRRTLSPYASCKRPRPAGVYRLAVALPAVVLGGVPWVLGIVLGNGLLLVFAVYMLSLAGADLLTLWLVRDLPSRTLVIDHPERAGCQIVLEL